VEGFDIDEWGMAAHQRNNDAMKLPTDTFRGYKRSQYSY
jgi:hypothetical protein